MKKEQEVFDEIIKQGLEGLSPDLKMGSWEKLSQRMDVVEETEIFDNKIKNHFNRINVPYSVSSWKVLAEKLALERGRIQAVLHYKAMEVSMLLLVLLTAWQYLPIETKEQKPQQKIIESSYPIASLQSEVNTNIITVNPGMLLEDNTISNQSEPAVKATVQLEKTIPLLTSSDAINGAENAIIITNKAQIEYRKNENFFSKTLETLPSVNQLALNSDKDPQTLLREHQAEKANELNSPTDDFRQDVVITSLDGKNLSLLDYGNPNELLEYIRPIERKNFIRIGFMGSPDYNRVITPTQTLDDGSEISLDRYSVSYSGGVSLGVEHGKWEIETGAVYAARKYQAIPTVYISGNIKDGYSALSLRDFELNTLDIPLKFRYNFFLRNKWRLYGQAGVSINLVLNANYYTVDQSAFASLPSTGNTSGVSIAEKPQALKDKQLTKGIIEGGSFLDNATPYAHFGLGIERYMSYRWSVFAQPSYQHALPFFNDGLGPYNDKIHNFGINTGLKVRL